ncbi:unnamed protein product [Cylindrotheca closterium]|uniref:PSI subunit V n=1 Tax=Cylindrotheca closterium TaxID=2856 RepID=A0AAD2FR20_9STRA|nr:unnamed protein product [Cylindrotheca closterium]
MMSSITRVLLALITTSAFSFQTSPTRFAIPSKSAHSLTGRNLHQHKHHHHHHDSRRNLMFLTNHAPIPFQSTSDHLVILKNANDEENDISRSETVASSDQLLLGGLGTFASLVNFYSEYTLFTTGCGLPAGPFGLVGLVEGLSYLGMLGIFSYSVVTKIRTGSGLPAGPFGLLGAAEGLSFLAILVGLVVLVSQVTNYGYIPNAVPMEGGMCS